MQINIPDDQYELLSQRAAAGGYADVSAFIGALANEPNQEVLQNDPRGPLTPEQLRQSAAELEEADRSIDENGGIELEEAFRLLAQKHGLSIQ